MNHENRQELINDDETELIFDSICFADAISINNPVEAIEGIKHAMELENRPILLEGIVNRLNEIGFCCTIEETDKIKNEILRRYQDILSISCPRTVKEWLKGRFPGNTNRKNHYELCMALEMNYEQTADFFQKYYFSMPYNVKDKTDAVFMHILYHNKSYETALKLLNESSCFVSQESAHTSTSQIFSNILELKDDESFLRYLSSHCYDNKQQFQLARNLIKSEVMLTQNYIKKYNPERILSENRLASITLQELLGFGYQSNRISFKNHKLPRHFTESIPNDSSFGMILHDNEVSYELLRKTLILLKFYNFYQEADNTDELQIKNNLLDFMDEMNGALFSCGFAQLYLRHPFDCLIMYASNTTDPIDSLYCIIENGRN